MQHFFPLFLFLVAVFPVLGTARDMAAIKKSGVIKIAVDGQTPGFNFFKGKELTGMEVELAEAMAKHLGLKLEWTVQPFNTLLVALDQDRFDLIATSHAITPEREKVADFTSPHYCTGAVIIAKVGGPKSKSDLAGKTVAVPVGTTYFDYLNKISTIKQVKTFPSEIASLQDLLSGRSDAWVSEEMTAYPILKAHKELQLGETLFPQRNAMVTKKGNRSLQTAINAELERILKDGTYKRISEKYFERDIRCP